MAYSDSARRKSQASPTASEEDRAGTERGAVDVLGGDREGDIARRKHGDREKGKRRNGDGNEDFDRGKRRGQLGEGMGKAGEEEDMKAMIAEREELRRRGRECPVPKPGGWVGEWLGFRSEKSGIEPSGRQREGDEKRR